MVVLLIFFVALLPIFAWWAFRRKRSTTEVNLSKKARIGFAILASFAMCCLYIFTSWYSVSPNGSDLPLEGAKLLLGGWALIVLMMFLGVPMAFLGMLFQMKDFTWSNLKSDLSVFAIIGPIFIFFIFVALDVGGRFKNAGFQQIVTRAQPLIEAIQRYQATNHVAPDSLDKLVPAYITNIPPTGAAAHPQFKFIRNRDAALFAGNPWILIVPISANKVTTSEFLTYYPKQNYPEMGLGMRDIPKFGNWALIELTTSDATNEGIITAGEVGY